MSQLPILQGVRTIQVTGRRCTLVDESGFSEIPNGKLCYTKSPRGHYYACLHKPDFLSPGKCKYSLHRLLMGDPKGRMVDHRNGDTFDNRRSNLRVCSARENHQNIRKSWGRSKYKGVCWCKHKERWKASVKTATVRIQRYFVDEKDAARAYDRISLEQFGEFACTNAEMFGDL